MSGDQQGALGSALPTGRPPAVGDLLAGRYKLTKKIGEGGMGAIYAGTHTTIDKLVAVKVLTVDDSEGRGFAERFLREAKAASRIRHEHVVDIVDFGKSDAGHPFYVMEFLDGEDLQELFDREGPLPWARVCHLSLQILDALEAAHALGYVHRDMKPANCYRTTIAGDADYIKLIDFGIAKDTSADITTLTDTGIIMGTAHYMAPEQATAEEIDARTDIYAMGVILFQLLSGYYPFDAPSAMGVLSKHITAEIPALGDRCPDLKLPSGVEAAIRKAMAKNPDDRFQSAAEMATALEVVRAEGVVTMPTGGAITAGGALVTPLAAAAVPAKGSKPWGVIGLAASVVIGLGAFALLRTPPSPPVVSEAASVAAQKVEPAVPAGASDGDGSVEAQEAEPTSGAPSPTGSLGLDPETAAPPAGEAVGTTVSPGEQKVAVGTDDIVDSVATPGDVPAPAVAKRSKSNMQRAFDRVSVAKCGGYKQRSVPVTVTITGRLKASGRVRSVEATNATEPQYVKCVGDAVRKSMRASKGPEGQRFVLKRQL